jgi:glycosyltransferase involved in cell wall biosynthesis
MRVVHLNTSDAGGAAMAAIQLHEALLEAGVESDLLTLNKTRSDVPRHHRVLPFELEGNAAVNRLSYKVRRAAEVVGLVPDKHNAPDNKNLLDRPAGYETFTVPYSFFDILEHPLVQAADIIHLHWVSYGMIDQGAFFRACKKPIVWTMHDMNAFTGGCHHADDCVGFESTCPVCPQLKDHQQAQVYWSYKQQAIAVVAKDRLRLVAPSQWLADRAVRSSIFKGRTCEVVPNGFQIDQFRSTERARDILDLPEGKKIILFSALDVMNPRKGMHYLLPALERMKDQNILLVSVGGRSVPMPDGVEVHDAGFVASSEQLALYYSAADLFVLPSVAENLPNTISEALLCGTPVVAFRVGGIPEQVHAGNGILVEPGDGSALEAAIHAALGMTWDHIRIAEQATERYDRRAIATAYQRIYSTWI